MVDEKTYWIKTHDGDPEMRALADRHYSREKEVLNCLLV